MWKSKYFLSGMFLLCGIISVFDKNFIIPMWMFIVVWCVVNIMEEMLDNDK